MEALVTETSLRVCRIALKRAALVVPAAIVLSLLGGASAYAASVTINFNSATSGPSLAAGSTAAQITTYMNSVLGCTCVIVTGAAADHTYNGEGHATGPGTGTTSLTLG